MDDALVLEAMRLSALSVEGAIRDFYRLHGRWPRWAWSGLEGDKMVGHAADDYPKGVPAAYDCSALDGLEPDTLDTAWARRRTRAGDLS